MACKEHIRWYESTRSGSVFVAETYILQHNPLIKATKHLHVLRNIQVSIPLLAVEMTQFLDAPIGVNVLAIIFVAEDQKEQTNERTNELYGA
jgi:hypothetical protein